MRPVLNSTICANFIFLLPPTCSGPSANWQERSGTRGPPSIRTCYGIPGPLIDGSDRIGGQAEFCCTAGHFEFGMHAQLGVRTREMTFYRALAEE